MLSSCSISEQFLQGPLGQTAARKAGFVVDQDRQYKTTRKIEGKADRTANVRLQIYLPKISTRQN